MKIIPFLLVVASLSSASALAGGRECLAQIDPPPTVESRVTKSIQEAVALAAAGSSVETKLAEVEATVQEESQLYIGAEGECLIRQRLEDEIAEMRARSHRYLLRAFEVEALEREIIFARLERAMLVLKRRWANGDMADDVFEKAIEALRIDAWQWIDAQGPITVRQRLQDAIFAAQQAAQNQIDVLHKQLEFFQTLYEARFQSAAFVLRKHLASGSASRRDYVRLEMLVDAYGMLREQFLPYQCPD